MAKATDVLVENMHAQARQRTGLADFGPQDYRAPFAMLAEHLATANMSAVGRSFIHDDLVGALAGRLVREDGWSTHPTYRSRRIDTPLIICGVPRTGTTALHKLLSVDPQFQGLNHWLTSWPKPRPPQAHWPEEPGYRQAIATLERLFELIPSLRVSHHIIADEVDECLEVLRLDFITNRYASMLHAPRYDAWMQAQDEQPRYRRLADTLRLIGLHDNRRWLLKNPGHFAEMEALLAVFPDARVIVTHRDPVKSIASLASVLAGSRQMIYTDAQLDAIGPRELAYWGKAKETTTAARARRPREQFFDVDHSRFHLDPMGVVRDIYTQFGIALAPATATAMAAWLAANPAGKHGEYRYNLADYGVTEAQIHATLGED